MVESFLLIEFSLEGFAIEFLLELLFIEIFVGDLHFGESMGFFLFQLFAIFVDLDGLLIIELFFELLVAFAFLFLLHLLSVPVVGLELLESFTITSSQILSSKYFNPRCS